MSRRSQRNRRAVNYDENAARDEDDTQQPASEHQQQQYEVQQKKRSRGRRGRAASQDSREDSTVLKPARQRGEVEVEEEHEQPAENGAENAQHAETATSQSAELPAQGAQEELGQQLEEADGDADVEEEAVEQAVEGTVDSQETQSDEMKDAAEQSDSDEEWSEQKPVQQQPAVNKRSAEAEGRDEAIVLSDDEVDDVFALTRPARAARMRTARKEAASGSRKRPRAAANKKQPSALLKSSAASSSKKGTVGRRSPVTVSRDDAILLEDSLDAPPARPPAHARAPSVPTARPSSTVVSSSSRKPHRAGNSKLPFKPRSSDATDGSTSSQAANLASMRAILGPSLPDSTLLRFLISANYNGERAISNILDSPQLLNQPHAATAAAAPLTKHADRDEQPHAAAQHTANGKKRSRERSDGDEEDNDEEVEEDDDDDKRWSDKPSTKQPTGDKEERRESEKEADKREEPAPVPWDRKLLVVLRVDASCTTEGTRIVSPDESVTFRDQSRDTYHQRMLRAQLQQQAQQPRNRKHTKQLRKDLRAERKKEHRILRFVPSANLNALEIGTLPRAVSDVLVPLFDRRLIDLSAVVTSPCPVKFDLLSSIPLLLSVYALPALFQLKREVRVESKGFLGKVVSTAADQQLNPVDTFLALLNSFHIDPVSSSIREEEVKLDSAPPIDFSAVSASDSAVAVDTDTAAAPVYEEELEAANELTDSLHEQKTAQAAEAQEDDKNAVKLSSFQLSALYKSAQAQYANLPSLEPSPRLRATLKYYQKQALYWMVQRERRENDRMGGGGGTVRHRHPLWEEYQFVDGERFYANPFSSQLSLHFPESSGVALGGLLGDEMGLGKTVMMISLLLYNHPSAVHSEKKEGDDGADDGDGEGDGETGETNSGERKDDGMDLEHEVVEHDTQQPTDSSAASERKDQRDVTDVLRSASRRVSSKAPAGSTLIVVPMSLIAQWRDEIERFSDLSVYVYYADKRADSQTLRRHDVVITSYGTLAAEAKQHQAQQQQKQCRSPTSALFAMRWYRAVLDEAHIIRNRLTEQSKACFLLQAERRWTLTGTPIQNKLDDVFPLLHFLREDPWSDLGWWRRVIARPFEEHDERALQRLKAVLQPLLLRRTKDMKNSNGESILDLPPREEEVYRMTFSETERDFYQAVYTRSKTQIEGYVKEGSILNKYIQVLTLLLRLRQACDHPYLCVGRGRTEKEWEGDIARFISRFAAKNLGGKGENGGMSVEYIAEVGETLKKMRKAQKKKRQLDQPMEEERKDAAESPADTTEPTAEPVMSAAGFLAPPQQDEEEEHWHECPICLSPPQDPVLTECGHMYCRECALSLCGTQPRGRCCICRTFFSPLALMAVPLPAPSIDIDFEREFKHSAKTAKLMSEIAALKREEPSVKSLIFSQWTSMLDIVQIPLQREGYKFLRLDGSLSQKAREQLLHKFKTDPSYTLLLISLKAGGVGLNLVSASCVFFLDCWWNPAVEQQAIDRVHRIGQTRTVRVKRFVIVDSVEERILEMQERKKHLAASVHSNDATTANTGDVNLLLECLR